MKRLLPQSLFGRLMVILSGGLIVAQLLSAAINFAERDQLLLSAAGIQPAHRIADAVKLLDSLEPVERRRIVALLNVPPQIVTLGAAPAGNRSGLTPQAQRFMENLREALGDDRPLQVAEHPETMPPGPAGYGYGRRRAMMEGREFTPGMYRAEHGRPVGAFYMIQVQLKDGAWVTFDTYVSRSAATLPLRLLATLAVLLATVLLLSYLAVRWVTRPLHVLAQAAEQLGSDINRPPLAETGPTELRQAAHAFNAMQARLRSYLHERTQVLAAMSHDLKTPITRLRLRAEMLDDEAQRQRFEKDLAEMEAMVAGTLDFMRGLESDEARVPVDIVALLESLQADYVEGGNEVTVSGAARPYIGMALQLKRCLANLLDNAIVFGQRADVAIEDGDDRLTIRICDHGPGIPDALLEKVFEPFRRVESSRNRATGGTGLGLSIARGIARAHGGDIELFNLPAGGLQAVVTLGRRTPLAGTDTTASA